MFTPFTSFDAMLASLGKDKILAKVNSKMANEAYRALRNKTQNEVLKAAKSDPRFKDIINTVKKDMRKSA